MNQRAFLFAVSVSLPLMVTPPAPAQTGNAAGTPVEASPSDAKEKARAQTSEGMPAEVSSEDRVQKIEDADLQFDVPKNWKLEQKPGPLGTAYRVVSSDGAAFALIPVEMDDLADRLAAMRAQLQKESKSYKPGVEMTGTINGFDYESRTDTMDGGATLAEIGSIGSNPPVVFMRSGAKAALATNAATLDRIFQSVKRTK